MTCTRNGLPVSLVDSNVLVYAHDIRDIRKQAVAIDVVSRLGVAGQAVVSAQCLSEFFSAVTRLPEPMTARQALDQVERIARACRVVDVSGAVVLEGLRGAERHGLSIPDALLWSAAKLNQVPVVLSEDFQDGRVVEGVRYVNPFPPGFDVGSLTA